MRSFRTGVCAPRRWLWTAGAVLLAGAMHASAKAAPAGPVGAAAGPQGSPPLDDAGGVGQRVTLDRVVAVVNSDLVLESDVDAERRFEAFQPFSEPSGTTEDQLVERLVDRDLILQQMKLQPEPSFTDAQVDAELALLRKALPSCAALQCETDAGWRRFIAAQGFTLQEVRDRWRERMEVLRFIEERFRMGIRISQTEIDDYYKKTMLPTYQKQGATPPAEASIADRIQEILLQQRVTSLLDDWLKALRAQGSVKIVKAGGDLP